MNTCKVKSGVKWVDIVFNFILEKFVQLTVL